MPSSGTTTVLSRTKTFNVHAFDHSPSIFGHDHGFFDDSPDKLSPGVDAVKDNTGVDLYTAAESTNDSQQQQQQQQPEDEPPPSYKLEAGASKEDVEDISLYVPGGHHPVCLGDALGQDGRFRVVHKLGLGGYATVWLCYDNLAKKWRAVRILAARCSTPDCADLKAITLFGGVAADVLAANHIQLALESFWIDGPNGRHLCFVLPFLGPRLTDLSKYYGHVPELMKDICFQLVEALRFIHSRGLCHGDFRPGNVLLKLAPGVDEWEENAIVKLLRKPELLRVERADGTDGELGPGVPSYLVERAGITYGAGACLPQIAVIDFGVSYPVCQPPVDNGTGIPVQYAAPEELFEKGDMMGFQTDIWALGNTISQVRRGFAPFADESSSPPEAFEMMESIIRPMPEPYRSVWWNWGFDFANCTGKDGEPMDDDDDSWKDESVLVTIPTKTERALGEERVAAGWPANHLLYRLYAPRAMCISKRQAVNIAAQAAFDPHRLPTYGRKAPSDDNDDDGDDDGDGGSSSAQYTMDRQEADEFFDLLLKMLQWLPEERATLDQISAHEWFGDRSRRQCSLPPTPPLSRPQTPQASSGGGNEAGARPRSQSPPTAAG